MTYFKNESGERLKRITASDQSVRRELAKQGLQALIAVELQGFYMWYVDRYYVPYAQGVEIPMPLEAFEIWKGELDETEKGKREKLG